MKKIFTLLVVLLMNISFISCNCTNDDCSNLTEKNYADETCCSEQCDSGICSNDESDIPSTNFENNIEDNNQ